jgi:hypothetical protein
MLQIYFLSILCNGLAGLVLLTDNDEELHDGPASFGDFFRQGLPLLFLGIACVLIGILKFLAPAPGNVPVVGDLLPALAGLIAGFMLIYDFYLTTDSAGAPTAFMSRLFNFKKYIGIFALAVAALHFIFPSALLL